ncbi:MAG: hypothetical protein OHK0032_09390 [Thermodesulfovibrionales bacterium]
MKKKLDIRGLDGYTFSIPEYGVGQDRQGAEKQGCYSYEKKLDKGRVFHYNLSRQRIFLDKEVMGNLRHYLSLALAVPRIYSCCIVRDNTKDGCKGGGNKVLKE